MSNLKRIREEKKLSQSQLSKNSGVNFQMIQKYEQGVKDINKAQGITLYNLAQALECKMEDLIEPKKIIESKPIITEEMYKKVQEKLKETT